MSTWKAHAKAVHRIAFTPDGKGVVTSGADERIRLWSWPAVKELNSWPGSKTPYSIAVSADSRYLATAGESTQVWLTTSYQNQSVISSSQPTLGVAFSPNSKVFLANGQQLSPLARWSLPSGTALPGGWGTNRGAKRFPNGAAAYDPQTLHPVTAYLTSRGKRTDCELLFWDEETGTEVRKLETRDVAEPAQQLVFSPRGSYLAVVHGALLVVWELTGDSARTAMEYHADSKPILGVVFSKDTRILYAVMGDNFLRSWSIPSCKEREPVELKQGPLTAVAVTNDGKKIALGTESGKVVLWDPNEGK